MDDSLKTLLQLAQLQETIDQPQREQQQVDQSARNEQMKTALGVMGLLNAKQQHETAAQDDLLHTLGSRPDMPTATLAEIAKAMGRPEVATGLENAHKVQVGKEVAKTKLLLDHAPSDNAKTQILGTVKDPEVLQQLAPYLPKPVAHQEVDYHDAGRMALEQTLPMVGFPPLAFPALVHSIYKHINQ